MAHTLTEAQVEVAEPVIRMTAQLKAAEKDARDAEVSPLNVAPIASLASYLFNQSPIGSPQVG